MGGQPEAVMKALAVALVLFATPAEANLLQQARDWAHCRLYPSHERCRPPAPTPPPPTPLPPPPAPAATPAPAIAPQIVKPPKAVKRVVTKTAPHARRIKSTWKPARLVGKGRGTWWCALAPKGTTLGRMRAEAKERKIAWTPQRRADAQDCLNSK